MLAAMYRDESEATRLRIETLEAKLTERDAMIAARDAEIGELTARVERLDPAAATAPPPQKLGPILVGAMTLLLAGHETTAVALAWTFALLAQNPDAEAALFAEVDALAGPPGFDDLARLPVTRQVFAESMRLRPPAWAVGREAARDTDLCGMPVRRGTTILFAPYFLPRDPRFWARPRLFDPDRFSAAGKADRHKFAYVPFSAGRRGCIGEQFAWTEGVLVLAALARRWRLRLAGPVPDAHGSVTLRPKGPLRMVAETR